ncbi:hypothetical protein GPJ56_001944 [Histomonas meleagridis]|uniref:uncharacterized protein n=1 Tax=Histomonas meleagridis TaxID=135588 RepID=UPI003559460F|nr:hypothetical protein GPJ56_001944 [Histomonas meleagridis]KAH0800980.1 hypothetical protein GO595_006296 [Histomonas meleagridis]
MINAFIKLEEGITSTPVFSVKYGNHLSTKYWRTIAISPAAAGAAIDVPDLTDNSAVEHVALIGLRGFCARALVIREPGTTISGFIYPSSVGPCEDKPCLVRGERFSFK